MSGFRERHMHSVLMGIAITVLGMAASPAQALLYQTWVTSGGDDTQTCDRPTPCATFATAHSKTIAGGKIGCLTSGQFGPLTITKDITIDCTGVQASVLAVSAGTDGITVTVPGSTKVVLRGLDMEGA